MGDRRVRIGLALLVGVTLLGTAWFWFVEGWSLVDSAYQTVTTVSTVGFGETREFDDSAKWFSIVLMVFGVAAALFTLGAVFQDQLDERLQRFGRKRMDRRIETLRNHAIVCGYGRVGRQVASSLRALEQPAVVIDMDDELCATATNDGLLTINGDSTEDETLKLAGIDRAGTLIVSLGDDAAAISTVLSARVLNPELRIVARANAASTEAKLLRAGCDRIVNPLQQGARRMVAFAQQPAVADFLDVVVHDGSLEYRLEELEVPADSVLAGTTLGDAHLRGRTGAQVLAMREGDGEFQSNPASEAVLTPGVTLIVIGTGDQLKALNELIGNRGSRA